MKNLINLIILIVTVLTLFGLIIAYFNHRMTKNLINFYESIIDRNLNKRYVYDKTEDMPMYYEVTREHFEEQVRFAKEMGLDYAIEIVPSYKKGIETKTIVLKGGNI